MTTTPKNSATTKDLKTEAEVGGVFCLEDGIQGGTGREF